MTDLFPNYLQVGDKKQQTDKQKKSCYTKKSSHRISPKSTGPEYQKPVAKIGLSKPPSTSIVIKSCEAEGSLIDGEIQVTLRYPTYMFFTTVKTHQNPSVSRWALHQLESTATVSQSHAEQRKVLSKSKHFHMISNKSKFAVLAASLLCNLQWCLLTL